MRRGRPSRSLGKSFKFVNPSGKGRRMLTCVASLRTKAIPSDGFGALQKTRLAQRVGAWGTAPLGETAVAWWLSGSHATVSSCQL